MKSPNTIKLAPALYQLHNWHTWVLTEELFSSSEAAKERLIPQFKKYIWPAIPDKDGFYHIPKEDNNE